MPMMVDRIVESFKIVDAGHGDDVIFPNARVRPKSVIVYSTLGGTSLKSCRATMPSAVKSRNCWISTFSLRSSTRVVSAKAWGRCLEGEKTMLGTFGVLLLL